MNRNLIGWVAFIAIAVSLFVLLNKGNTQYATIALSDFHNALRSDSVGVVEVGNDQLKGELKTPLDMGHGKVSKFQVTLPAGTTNGWNFMNWLLENRQTAKVYATREAIWLDLLLPLIPWVVIFGFIWFFVFRNLRKGGSVLPPQ
jgi:cell division protease FtsH